MNANLFEQNNPIIIHGVKGVVNKVINSEEFMVKTNKGKIIKTSIFNKSLSIYIAELSVWFDPNNFMAKYDNLSGGKAFVNAWQKIKICEEMKLPFINVTGCKLYLIHEFIEIAKSTYKNDLLFRILDVIGDASEDYNCFSYVCGCESKNMSIRDLQGFLRKNKYQRVEAKKAKCFDHVKHGTIAIYRNTLGQITHAATYKFGTWISKIGVSFKVKHSYASTLQNIYGMNTEMYIPA